MYIEREALIKAVAESLKNNPHKDAKVSVNHITEHQHFARLIERQPATDVAPVVRCGECERRDESADLTHSVLCHYMGVVMPKDGFCSYGERIDRKQEDT